MKKEFIFRLSLVAVIALLVYQFGIKPAFIDDQKYIAWAEDKLVKDKGKYDVIVIGEEPEGIAAALSSARSGASTLLLSGGKELGGYVEACFQTDMEANYNSNKELLNRGIFEDLYDKLGNNFSIDKYKTLVSSMVGSEKRLVVLYNSKVLSPVMENNAIRGINILRDGKRESYFGKRFIDATSEGDVLSMCDVPYFVGSEDINMKYSFQPVRLNFQVEGIDYKKLKEVIKSNIENFNALISAYETSYIDIKIRNLNFCDQQNGKIIVEGIEAIKVNTTDEKAMNTAYNNSVKEAKDFTEYIKKILGKTANTMKFCKAAANLYIRESTHYIGEHTLGVNEILNNKDFSDKIAVGAYPLDASKFNDESGFIIGNPLAYSIPLGCIIPLKADNILMVGKKISYSSIASTSTVTMCLNTTIGEAAGIVAVYSIVKGVTPRELLYKKNTVVINELHAILAKQGVYIPKISIPIVNRSNWCFQSLEQLNTLALVAGGMDNNYKFNRTAKAEEFTSLLLNGIYRLSPEKYSLDIDYSLSRYFTQDTLTKSKAGEILARLNNVNISNNNAYEVACKKGYINGLMQQRLKNRDILEIDDVLYIAAFNIKNFTGKDIQSD